MMKKQFLSKLFVFCLATFCLILMSVSSFAQTTSPLASKFQTLTFSVDGVTRTALLYVPATAKTKSSPLVFVFHGHGGNSAIIARHYEMDRLWPNAISVYMQGLKTALPLTDPEGERTGWQHVVGQEGDRDLHFFDAVLARLKHDYKVDPRRIYATGHSNGGVFTYLLWFTRGDVFAAVAPSSAIARRTYARKLQPKPCMMIGGLSDPIVKPEWQQLMMHALIKDNHCSTTAQPFGGNSLCKIYPSETGAPLVTFFFPGGHRLNRDALPIMVKFFKENPKKN